MRETGRRGIVQPLGGSRLVLGVVLAGSLVLIGAGLYGLVRNFESPLSVQAAGEFAIAPAFTLSDLDGRKCPLARFLGDKPILLEFMDPTCPHCQEMAPILTRLHGAYGSRVRFLTVAFEGRNDPRRVRRFAEAHAHPWPYLMGTMDVARAYRVEGVPSFFLITPDGRIRGVLEGSASYEAMCRWIEALLAGR